MPRLMFVIILALAPSISWAQLKVFACEPEWAALAETLGGEQVSVYSATTALQDPHHIQARPSLLARVRSADLLICTGAELEAGWLPLLLRQSGNAAIQPGRPGHFLAAEHVALMDVPQQVDRSRGDVHASGNPHIVTDPNMLLKVSMALTPVLVTLLPQATDDLLQRQRAFSLRWQQAILDWEQQARGLRGVKVVSQHGNWRYLYQWLGLEEVAVLEAVPGVPPSGSQLLRVAQQLRQQPAAMVIRAAYQTPRPSQWLQSQVTIAEVVLPYSVGADDMTGDLFSLYDVSVKRLLAGVKGQ